MPVSRAILMAALVLSLGFVPGPASAELGPEAALELTRKQWFEGIPEEQIETLSRDAQRALGALLEDPDEVEHHATAIDLLGLAGDRPAFPLVTGYERRAAAAHDGDEVSSAVHRARMAVPVALGRLAQRDERALRRLLRDAERSDGPRWRTKRMNEERVTRLHRELCALGLGLSGRDEAPAALRRMSAAGDREAWQRHVAQSLELHRRNAPKQGGKGR